MKKKKATKTELAQLSLILTAFFTLFIDSSSLMDIHKNADVSLALICMGILISFFQKDKKILLFITLPWLFFFTTLKFNSFGILTWFLSIFFVVMIHYIKWDIYGYNKAKNKKKYIITATAIILPFFIFSIMFISPGYNSQYIKDREDMILLDFIFALVTYIHVFTTSRLTFQKIQDKFIFLTNKIRS